MRILVLKCAKYDFVDVPLDPSRPWDDSCVQAVIEKVYGISIWPRCTRSCLSPDQSYELRIVSVFPRSAVYINPYLSATLRRSENPEIGSCEVTEMRGPAAVVKLVAGLPVPTSFEDFATVYSAALQLRKGDDPRNLMKGNKCRAIFEAACSEHLARKPDEAEEFRALMAACCDAYQVFLRSCEAQVCGEKDEKAVDANRAMRDSHPDASHLEAAHSAFYKCQRATYDFMNRFAKLAGVGWPCWW